MTAHDPMQKEMATEKKEERIREAELEKREAREHNAASKQVATATGHGGGNYTTGTGTGTGTATYSTTGEYGHPMGGHQMSAMPGQGTGHPVGGHVTEGVVGTHPVGVDRGTGRTTAHNTPGHVGGYGTGPTGGTYS